MGSRMRSISLLYTHICVSIRSALDNVFPIRISKGVSNFDMFISTFVGTKPRYCCSCLCNRLIIKTPRSRKAVNHTILYIVFRLNCRRLLLRHCSGRLPWYIVLVSLAFDLSRWVTEQIFAYILIFKNSLLSKMNHS